jgi:PAS domain S-box-containing protein
MNFSHDERPEGAQGPAREDETNDLKLQELQGGAPAGVAFLSGPKHKFSYVNDLYLRVVCRSTADELLGLPFAEALPELKNSGVFDILDEVYRKGEAYRGGDDKVTLQMQNAESGEDRFFDFSFHPVCTSTGRTDGIFVLAVDMTDRVLSRREVELSEERLRLAQEAAQIGTWEWDPAENTRTLSKEMHRMFGTDPNSSDERVYRLWSSRVFPGDWPKVSQAMAECQRTGILDIEYRFDHPERGLRYLYSKGRRMGRSKFFGVVSDITDRKRQIEESQLKLQTALDASQRLSAIVESSDDAIIGKDLNGMVTSWNPCAERVFGYMAEEMIGQSIRKVIPPEVLPDEDRIMSAVAQGERTEHFETARLTKNGDRIEVSLTLSPVFDERGEIVGVASISRDISHQKKVEKALHTSERLATVGKLAATIAHEINNPLEAVTNLVFLAQGCMGNPEGKVFLEQAQQELARMALLTKQTLGFYRENKGARQLTLGELITPLVSVFSARARNKQISIETDIRENPTLMGIPGEIRQLFANLLNNSIDAVSDRGRILIRLSAAHQYKGHKRAGVRLTVCDNGPGIAPEVRKKLFEPFFTTKRDVGTGLGLWVSSNILRKHDGTIRLRSSVAPGKSWTVFSVFFPIESDLAAATTN